MTRKTPTPTTQEDPTQPPRIARIYCHVGVHINNKCETTFNADDGYIMQEGPYGVTVSAPPDLRYTGPAHEVLVPWSNLHAVRKDL